MTLFENKAFNGKMTEYVLSQIMYGYAPPSLGIGYEVNIVDWVQNPNPEEYVVVSSSETLPPEMAAPTIQMAQGHLDAVSSQRESGNVPTTRSFGSDVRISRRL